MIKGVALTQRDIIFVIPSYVSLILAEHGSMRDLVILNPGVRLEGAHSDIMSEEV